LTKKILIPFSSLRPAQVRYAPAMVANHKILIQDGVYDGGEALAVHEVVGHFYSLIDHHHHVLKAIQEGATHGWGVVKNTWSLEEYQQRLQRDRLCFSQDISFYCRNLQGQWVDPFYSMADLLNRGEHDSLRTFVSLHKTKETYDYGVLVNQEPSIKPNSFWRKIIGNPPKDLISTPAFAEFILSDVLRAMGFLEHSTDTDHARHLLRQAKTNPPPVFPFVGWQGFNLDWVP